MKRLVLALCVVVIAGVSVFYLLSREPTTLLDDAKLLDDNKRAFIEEYHGYLVADHDIDYRVVTTTSEAPILEDAVGIFERLGIGSRSEEGRGLLLVINPVLNRVRLEVGYALEGVFPDAFVAYIEQRQMVPFFADGRIADGILATTELIVDRAQRSVERDGSGANEVWMMGSGGAGAETEARIEEGYDPPAVDPVDGEPLSSPAQSPEAALSAYFRAMDAHNASPQLPIYSSQTQAMLHGRTVTPAQMDMIVRTYRDCSADPVRYNDTGQLAVIRYAPSERRCSPWFFVKSGEYWTLDLAAMGQAIRFGRTNAWHRSDIGFGDYAFAFDDWTFDRHGFPL